MKQYASADLLQVCDKLSGDVTSTHKLGAESAADAAV